MATFVELDENNIVIRGAAIADEDCLDANGNELEAVGSAFCNRLFGGRWIKTSVNTRMNTHYGPDNQPDGGVPFRKNYGGIGYYYDEQRDAFIGPKIFPSWVLDEETCDWVAPVPHPTDGDWYDWDENTLNWVKRQ